MRSCDVRNSNGFANTILCSVLTGVLKHPGKQPHSICSHPSLLPLLGLPGEKVSVIVSSGCRNKIQLGGLHNRNLFLTVLESGSPRSRSIRVQIRVQALFLAHWWPPSCWILTWPFLWVWAGRAREWEWSLWESRLIRTLIILDQSPTLRTSFNQNYFLIGPTFKYSHIGG